jgi:hypothetical protein
VFSETGLPVLAVLENPHSSGRIEITPYAADRVYRRIAAYVGSRKLGGIKRLVQMNQKKIENFLLDGGCVPSLSSRFLFLCLRPEDRERGTVAKVIERVEAHYEVQDVEMGKVYTWRPQSVVVECQCGDNQTLTASKHACEECGADHRPVVEEVLEAHPDEDEEGFDHPWRSLRPYYSPTRGT